MTDPLKALRTPITPADPDPIFAARLRERLRRALLGPTGTTTGDSMSFTSTGTSSAPTSAADQTEAEARVHSLTPYLCVDDGPRALEWYARVFDARPRREPVMMEDGRVGHAELAIGDSVLMLADEWPELELLGPKTRGGPSQSIYLTVPDVDTVVGRAVAEGAELTRPVADQPYGRNGVIIDPFGHRWMINSPPAPPTGPRHGDIAYASLRLPEVDQATAFYGSVLEWHFATESTDQGRQRQVEGLPHQRIGLWGGQDHRTLFLCFAVDDVHQAVERIRSAGGEAEEPHEAPYGQVSMCTDDQGMIFAVYEDPDKAPAASARPPVPPLRASAGEISYVTLEVPDSARARAFFGTVLDWRFIPGRVPDGWSVQIDQGEVHPMTGMHGGHDRPTVVPVYAVDDIDAAVSRVRAAGGTASDPERRPYGTLAECVDNQGSRFYLGGD
ncbi:VOC family protein [Actinomadura vinacea]|uniref:VOC family protein n=1 Tax=Actinomadura vinacea TaxID=115336 RepID=A0ABN3J0J7_9ACTN